MQITETVIINVKNGNKNMMRYKFATEQLSFINYFRQYLKETIKNIDASGTIIIKSKSRSKSRSRRSKK